MLKLTTLLKNFKKKIAAGAVGAVLIASPGVALAHGNYQHHDNDSRRHWSYNNNNWHNHDNDNWDQNCEERQAAADQKVANFKAKVQEHYNGLGTYLFNQQVFVSDNNLTIENYDKYNEKAMNAQTKTQEALDDISSPTIDCDQWEGKDKRQVRHAEQELRKAIERFETSVQKLSYVIADNVVIS